MSLLTTDAAPFAPSGSGFTAAEPPDADLVGDALRGEKHAYSRLVQRYSRAARAACFAVLRDWHLAEDAAQDAFVNAYMNLRRLRKPEQFAPWLLTIMRNRSKRMVKTRQQVAPAEIGVEREAIPESAPDTEQLILAIDRLPDHERAVVMLRYFEGHDAAGIARFLGKSVGTVTKQLSRAHRRLEKWLKD